MKLLEQLKLWWYQILAIDNGPLINTIIDLKEDFGVLIKELDAKDKEILLQAVSIGELEEEITHLHLKNEELEEQLNTDYLETYWNNKILPTTVTYPGRDGKNMDVRKYLTRNNDKSPKVHNGSNDLKARECHEWVYKNIKYVSDGKEHWQYANETFERGKGDCEDGAILMANMMLKAGIPYWRVRVNAGDVQGGGHAYVVYLREEDNRWYVLDWCYWANESRGFRKTWSSAKKYFGVWFSFNRDYAFRKSELDRL